jgi:PIN domain nuclease of toxin-antitoxin system
LSWHHVGTLSGLPLLHRDPFDRLLIAQALAEKIPLVTADPSILGYPDVVLIEA